MIHTKYQHVCEDFFKNIFALYSYIKLCHVHLGTKEHLLNKLTFLVPFFLLMVHTISFIKAILNHLSLLILLVNLAKKLYSDVVTIFANCFNRFSWSILY